MSVGRKIKEHYENNLHALSRYKRCHFAKRMHRITGDARYLKHAQEHLSVMKEHFEEDVKKLGDKEHIKKRSEEIYDKLSDFGTPEAQTRRRNVFRDKKEHLFFYYLIETGHMLREAGAFDRDAASYRKWVEFLRNNIDFSKLLLKEDIFREFSTQLVNYVYFLKIDGITDKTKEFRQMFNQVFSIDEGGQHFINKIYTMTHFIIAASDYYQQFVDPNEFEWVLNYFRQNMERIINETNPDVIFEVGLCFKLAGMHNAKEIELARSIVAREHDAELGYIPRKDKSLEQSEHANIMAIMLMHDFYRLHRGPKIN